MAVWDGIVAAVTHRRSWAIALLIAAASGAFMALAGSNTGADKPPLLVPPSSESARAAALSKSFPGEDQVPAILVVSRSDGSALTPGDLSAAESARQARAGGCRTWRRRTTDCFAGRLRRGGANSHCGETGRIRAERRRHRAAPLRGGRVARSPCAASDRRPGLRRRYRETRSPQPTSHCWR